MTKEITVWYDPKNDRLVMSKDSYANYLEFYYQISKNFYQTQIMTRDSTTATEFVYLGEY